KKSTEARVAQRGDKNLFRPKRRDQNAWLTCPNSRFTPLACLRTLSLMSLTVNEGNRLSGQPVTSEESFSHRKTLETALRRSQDYLFSIQRPEGFWVGELMVDSTLVSDTIAYHHWNGKVDPE